MISGGHIVGAAAIIGVQQALLLRASAIVTTATGATAASMPNLIAFADPRP